MRHILSNIVLESSSRFDDYPSLYYRSGTTLFLNDSKRAVLLPGATYDFATYFNACSQEKWREYTSLDNFNVNLRVKGRLRLALTAYDRNPEEALHRTVLATHEINSSELSSLDFNYPKGDHTLIAFEITALDPCEIESAHYFSNVDEAALHEVNLALAITTYKQEEFIRENLALLEGMMQDDSVMGEHLFVHVVDNGQTLEVDTSVHPHVFLHPNKNVGGAGGFARGMIEAMEQQTPEAITHVLVMDDDVNICLDSIKRTYQLLCVVNNRYLTAFVSGAMLSMTARGRQVEDVGHIRDDAIFGPIKPQFSLLGKENILSNELIFPKRERQYAAFWYCCVPVTEIKKQGLPLPFFIRCDDAEFGLRTPDRQFMTMNGICVWHIVLGRNKFRANMECYLTVRNCMVISSVTESCDTNHMDMFRAIFVDYYEREIKKFGYANCELILDGMEDYLKGPDYLGTVDGSDLLARHNAMSERSETFDIRSPRALGDLYQDEPRSFKERLIMHLSDNGQKHIPESRLDDTPAYIPNDFWFYPAKRIFLKKTLIMLNDNMDSGIVRKMDRNRYATLDARYHQLIERWKNTHESVEHAYREAMPTLTSDSFWKVYLSR